MATEKRLIDANAMVTLMCRACNNECSEDPCEPGECFIYNALANAPTVDAVEVVKYKALLEMYHDLRENFIDYVCSGVLNVAPYCLNKRKECVDGYGWCKHNDKCKGFNPAEVILDGAKMDGDGNG